MVFKPVLTGPDEIRRMCLSQPGVELRGAGGVDRITFSPAKMWIAGLAALQKPLAHLHTSTTARYPGPRSTWIS